VEELDFQSGAPHAATGPALEAVLADPDGSGERTGPTTGDGAIELAADEYASRVMNYLYGQRKLL
jgi:hypothetical protein